MLRLLDLFSGIGGFSLGMEATKRIKTIGFVEKDKFCQKVLQKNFKNIPIEEDIRNVKGSNYTADIVSGGFPCQPFSVAGKRRGQDDDRYLWDETIRVVAETKPKWFVGENVEGIININNGLVLRQVQTDLEKEGFQVQCLIIPASGIGAWHQRKRVWILGYSEHNGSSSAKIKRGNFETSTRSSERQNKTIKFKRTSRSNNNGNVPNTNSRLSIRENKEIQARGNTINSSSKDVSNSNSRLRRGRGTEQESRANEIWRFYSKKEEQTEQHIRSKAVGCNFVSSKKRKTWWQTQSELCGVPYGLSEKLHKDRSNRIKALGNSIVPQIAYEIGKAIVDAEISQD